ncbi:MAG: PAS domain S-box protein [Symploca sp. SIO3C6]|uniref:histidine kinase n=1 Tax=Symploca sp. SIO1C4 TaxID=2607765 RepID=A0A6B3NEF9_9CYAN|nr:PAS domain S-box protein [Symploca sp. SIO3C6]NER31499.1 PAS domain S-box protein [Symploca sp. SIO1C4]
MPDISKPTLRQKFWLRTKLPFWTGGLVTASITILVETLRQSGIIIPIPFLLVILAVLLTASIDGLKTGMISSAVWAIYVIYATTVPFGPPTLTGGPVQVISGILAVLLVAMRQGWVKDQVDKRTKKLKQTIEQLNNEIAEHQQTEAALRQSEELLRRVFNEAPVGMALADKDYRFFKVNRILTEMLGYTESELIGMTFIDITYPEDLNETNSFIQHLHKGQIGSFRLTKRYLKKNQEILWANVTVIALQDEKGELIDMGMVEDITEGKKTFEALQQSEARYRAIVEDQTELICRFQADGTLTFVNDAYCRYFGKQRSELIGYNFVQFIPVEDQEIPSQIVNSLSWEKPISTGETRVISAEGTICWQQWTSRILFDEQGNFIEYQAVGRDITKLKQAEAEVRTALAKEKEISELRSKFVSLVSHEFRTPLTTIQSSAQILERYSNRLSEEKKISHHYRIQRGVERITKLLDEVLLIGKAEAGKLKFEPAPMDLVAFCYELVESQRISASPKHTLTFIERFLGNSRSEGAYAQMDGNLLEHILTNLLSNAIKYSPEGGTIEFELICNSQSATFRIQDNGIGIPPEDLGQLFESFKRASNVTNIPGTGMGLAIVKQCVDLHRGTIAVDSELGVGSTFTVTMPLHCAN